MVPDVTTERESKFMSVARLMLLVARLGANKDRDTYKLSAGRVATRCTVRPKGLSYSLSTCIN